jgi:large subunit ribosomal protein L18
MKNTQKVIQAKAARRRVRIRVKLFGTAQKPRLSVFRSAKHLFLQLIDDSVGKTLVSVKDQELKSTSKPMDKAKECGQLLAKKAATAGITEAIFDRGVNKYHGRIKSVADGAREGGLKF